MYIYFDLVYTVSVLVTVYSIPSVILNLQFESNGSLQLNSSARMGKGCSLGLSLSLIFSLVSGRRI